MLPRRPSAARSAVATNPAAVNLYSRIMSTGVCLACITSPNNRIAHVLGNRQSSFYSLSVRRAIEAVLKVDYPTTEHCVHAKLLVVLSACNGFSSPPLPLRDGLNACGRVVVALSKRIDRKSTASSPRDANYHPQDIPLEDVSTDY